ncbi:MAG: DUF2947 domain-containing protein [Pontibacterium sp.]
MSYIALSDYSKGWIFRHRELPISAEHQAEIRPLTERRANEIWRAHISKASTHYSHFQAPDWAARKDAWLEESEWQAQWESDSNELPELLAEWLDWDKDTVVYVCYDSDNIIEIRWEVFKAAWKNFLFLDDGTLVIGKKRKQAAQFFEDGSFKLGQR